MFSQLLTVFWGECPCVIALDSVDRNWLACRDLCPTAGDATSFFAVGTFCDEVVAVKSVLVCHGGSV